MKRPRHTTPRPAFPPPSEDIARLQRARRRRDRWSRFAAWLIDIITGAACFRYRRF